LVVGLISGRAVAVHPALRGLAACQDRRSVSHYVADVSGDGLQLGGGRQAADVHAVVVGGADLELLRAGDERGGELVADGLGDVEALDGDGQM
jgi:hypothetical protein